MNRSTRILLLLLLVLGGITYFLKPSGEERQSSYDAGRIRLSVDSTAVMRIDIKRPTALTTLQNVGGVWMVTSPFQYAADPATVRQLLSGLSKFKVGSLVSSNPEKQHIFQVDSTGTFVTLTDRSGAAVQAVFGKMGPSFTEVYFRTPDSKDVFLGEGIDSWMLTREPKEWRDKTIYATNTLAIKEIEYTVGGATTSFSRDSAGWVANGKRANIDMLNPALTALMGFKADDFIDSSMQFKTRPVTVQVKGPDEVTLSLYPLDAESTRYAVQSSKSGQLFSVSRYSASQLLRPTERGALTSHTVASSAAPPAESEAQQAPAEVEKTSPPAVSATPEKTPVVKSAPAKAAPVQTPPSAAPKVAEKKEQPRTVPQEQKAPPIQQQPAPVRKSVTEKTTSPTAKEGATTAAEDEGELTIHTVKKGETMTTISKKYNVTVDQIIKWNQLKSISVRPGQELYVFIKK